MTIDYDLLQPDIPSAWSITGLSADLVILDEPEVATLRVGDWVVVVDPNGEYSLASDGAVGRVTSLSTRHYRTVEFEVDTLSAVWRHLAARSTVSNSFSIDCQRLHSIIPEPFRLERLEQTAAREAEAANLQAAAELAARDEEARRCRRAAHAAVTTRNLNSRNSPHASRRYRRDYSELSALVAAALDTARAEDQLRALQSASGDVARKLYNLFDRSNICSCNDCSAYAHVDDMYDAQGSIVCRSCLEDHYNHSDCMDTYLSSDAAREVYDSAYALRREQQDDYCTHSWGRSNLRTWDGLFVTQNAYDELYDEDRDEDDEDRDEDNDGLVDYHSSFRNFREQNSTPAVPALGVELEVYAEDRGDCVESVKNEMPNDWIFERDASLCESYGFEIISQPYGPTEWAEHAVNLLRTLNNNDACGYSGDAGSGYGIHINVHRRNLSPLQEARLMMFLLVDSNREFVKSIAQRDQIYGSSLHQIGSIMAPTIAKIGGLHTRTKRKPQGLGKYCPLNLNNDIAEFRLFQSTLYLPSFMKNLEFVWALVEWTNVRATTGTSTDHMQFVMWLGATSERIQRYPHLVAYLRKPSFLGIGFEARIKNTWRHLLPVTTTKSHDVVSGNADLRLAA